MNLPAPLKKAAAAIGGMLRFQSSDTPTDYLEASASIHPGYGMNGAKPRPWNYRAGMRNYVSWMYAAANKNAHAVAGVPLRLYTHVRPGTTPKRAFSTRKGFDQKAWIKAVERGEALAFGTRALSGSVKDYLRGDGALRPSERVWRKAVEFGGDIEEVTEPHPSLSILQTANDWWNGYEYTCLRILDLQITGNSYLFNVTDPQTMVPASIWRMPPQWTSVIPDQTHRDLVIGYSYGYAGNEKPFPAEDITHFRLANPDDQYYGKGWFEANWTAQGLHNSKREEDLAIHDNMSRPDYLFSLKGGGANKDTMARLETAVNEKLRGTDKRGKFLVVSGDVAAQALNLPVPEVGTPTRVIEEIAAISGVPVAMLLSNDPTKATSVVARLGWYRDTIHGYCKTDEEKLNEKHLTRFAGSEDLVLAYDPASFEDREQVVKEQVALVTAGIRTPNQANVSLGFQRQDDPQADRLYPPAGNTGGAAALAGNQGPGQNDDRHNEDA